MKRGVSLKTLDAGEPKVSGKEYRLSVALKEGITQDNAKKISKIIRDEGPSGVRARSRERSSGSRPRRRTTCRTVISLLKGKDFDFALQFINYR